LMAQVLNDLAYLTNGLYVDFLSVFKDQNKKMPKLISQLAHTSWKYFCLCLKTYVTKHLSLSRKCTKCIKNIFVNALSKV
jgi:hypothetical protein